MNLLTADATRAPLTTSSPIGFPLRRTLKVRIGFEAHWLRETAGSIVDAEFGTVFDSGFDALVEVEAHPRLRLRARASSPMPDCVDGLVLFLLGIKNRGENILRACSSWDALQQLEPDGKGEFESVFGHVGTPADYARVKESVAAFIELRNRILRASLTAIEWDYRCRAAAGPGRELPPRASLQLLLPAMEKRHWNQRLTVLPNCEVEAGWSGTVVLRPRVEQSAEDYKLHYQTALALGANWAPATSPPTFHLGFSDDQTFDRDQLDLLLQPMLAFHGLSESASASVRAIPPDWQRINVEFTLRVPGAAARAWLRTPKERSSAFNAFFGDISQTLQRTLRAWIPYARCGRRHIFSTKDEVYALLAYQVSRPFCRRRRPEFTYDPMNRSSVRQACRNTRTSMAGKLEEVRRFLQKNGQVEDSVFYEAEDLDAILSRVQSGNRTFLSLLAADFISVERLRKLGAWCRKLQLSRGADPDKPVRHVLRAATEVNRVFRTRFKRLSTEDDLSNLGNLLLVVGTAAASEHFGQPAPIEVSVRLANADSDGSDGEFVLQNTIRIGAGGVGIINASP